MYDITERKNFCSDECFRRSSFLKQQVSTVPLWLREKKEAEGEPVPAPRFYDEGADKERLCGKGVEVTLVPPYVPTPEKEEDAEEEDEQGQRNASSTASDDQEANNLEKEMQELRLKDRNLLEKKKEALRSEDGRSPLEQVEQSLKSWFTVDTLMFLRGEEPVKQVLNGAEDAFRQRHSKLCMRLGLMETPVEKAEIDKPELSLQNKKLESYMSGKTFIESDEVPEKTGAGDGDREPNLPLLDRHAQGALRRKIVHDQLDRA